MTERKFDITSMIDDIERMQSVIDDLMKGCNALRGLLHLVLARDDLPPDLREVLATSYRIDVAAAAIERATETMQRIGR